MKGGGPIKNPGQILEDTLEAAKWFRPHHAYAYGAGDDDESDENNEFVTLFIKDQIRSLKALSQGFKTSTTKLCEQVGGRATTILDFKAIMDRLLGAVDRDDVLRWGAEVVR
jgi:hypothetical protein